MKTQSLFLKVLPLILLLVSCVYNVEEKVVVPDPDPNPNPVTSISFKNAVKPIIDNNCVKCHNGSQFPDLRTYTGIKAKANRISIRVANRTMPLGGSLTQEEIDIVVKWVKQGAKNN